MPNLSIRRPFFAIAAFFFFAAGCSRPANERPPELIYGSLGTSDGKFSKPRAVTIDKEGNLYIVDMTARIQVFDRDGKFLRSWNTPEHTNGRPSGLSFDRQGRLRVADTHYFRVLTYTAQGELLKELTIGGKSGNEPGEFQFVTDFVEDSQGNMYVSQYGEFDRIQKFDKNGKYLFDWGSHGTEPGQFLRPQKMDIDENDCLWIADAANHRVQVFDARGDQAKLIKIWGEEGEEVGKLRYPYDILLDGEFVYLCEFGNQRVQKFTRDGESVAWWGRNGRQPGELHQPWGMVKDSQGRIHVLDSYNHRVQRFRM